MICGELLKGVVGLEQVLPGFMRSSFGTLSCENLPQDFWPAGEAGRVKRFDVIGLRFHT